MPTSFMTDAVNTLPGAGVNIAGTDCAVGSSWA